MIARCMTAEEFAATKFELPDGGRWAELLSGEPVVHDPPSDAHGNCVLNLSKALAKWLQESRDGYACFELGLIVERAPDTVLCPSISYFVTGERWAEMDNVVTETRPGLVVDVTSTPDRLRLLGQRLEQYRLWGIGLLWVIDPAAQTVTIHRTGAEPQLLTGDAVLASGDDWICPGREHPLLPGFQLPVSGIFQQPDWWTGHSSGHRM